MKDPVLFPDSLTFQAQTGIGVQLSLVSLPQASGIYLTWLPYSISHVSGDIVAMKCGSKLKLTTKCNHCREELGHVLAFTDDTLKHKQLPMYCGIKYSQRTAS